jgi:hypothetical protein
VAFLENEFIVAKALTLPNSHPEARLGALVGKGTGGRTAGAKKNSRTRMKRAEQSHVPNKASL